jgi:hypothetical protein
VTVPPARVRALATAIGALLSGTSLAQHLELEEVIVTASPLRERD